MAFAPNYAAVLSLRLAMLAVAAVFTPQAASTIGLLVPEKDRSGAISFVFLGWSLAVAAGLPLIAFISAYAGWRAGFLFSAFSSLVPCILLAFALPRALRGPPLSLQSFNILARNRKVILLLSITILSLAAQFTVFVYLGPLLQQLAGASHETVGLMFALFGVAGFIGNVTASRIVGRLGGWLTSAIFIGSTFAGIALWALGTGVLPVMGAGIALMGLGFAATNSMQQARLGRPRPICRALRSHSIPAASMSGRHSDRGSAARCTPRACCRALAISALPFPPPAWRSGRSRATAMAKRQADALTPCRWRGSDRS